MNQREGKQDLEMKILRELIETGLKKGTVKPLKRRVFDRNQAEEAFRFMAAWQHIEKVLIKMTDSNGHAQKSTNVTESKS